jgi:hypothetical protein
MTNYYLGDIEKSKVYHDLFSLGESEPENSADRNLSESDL